jgi:multiple sugar transport system substrate-binding protein
MKNKGYLLVCVILLAAFALGACAPTAIQQPTAVPPTAVPPTEAVVEEAPVVTEAPAMTEAPAATEAPVQNVDLEYWTFPDYASGPAGDLQKEFIAEFEAAHPGVKINITGKGGDELNAATISSAASGTLPDINTGTTSMGGTFIGVNALKNIYDKWMAEPEEFRAQFNPQMLAEVTPADNTMWAIPYTGYATFLYRNLKVLKAAGIDPNEKVETWDQWLAQMKKVKEAGYIALPTFYYDWWDFTNIYSGAATEDEWGIDFENKTTKINPEKYIQTVKFLEAAKEYGTDLAMQDQATTDLFLSDKLAFLPGGPWMDPTYQEGMKNTGLEYDYVLIPGATPDNKGGIRGTEMVTFSPTSENFDLAWEYVKYMIDEPQMKRWAEALGRFNSNDVVIAEVDDPLLAITADAAKSSLFERPPHFVAPYPGNYYQALQDNLAQISSGQMTPEEGAAALIESLNAIIAEE